MQPKEEVPRVRHRRVVRLDKYLPHVDGEPLIPDEPFAPLAIYLEYVYRLSLVTKFCHCLFQRFEFGRVGFRLFLRGKAIVMERRVRLKRGGEVTISLIVRYRVERVHLAVAPYLLDDGLLELCLSVRPDRVNKAVLLSLQAVRVTHPLGPVGHRVGGKAPCQRTNKLDLKVRAPPHVCVPNLLYIPLVFRSVRVLLEISVIVRKKRGVISLGRPPVFVGYVVEVAQALTLCQFITTAVGVKFQGTGRHDFCEMLGRRESY
mmetsp:Transcript_20735/g.46045  ORF Transcript_20735/g.46045 Transcript_20735/m.46045 type:complete len:261 (+) Transcript_20735:768-1550(+)